jgi:hypothetical protein
MMDRMCVDRCLAVLTVREAVMYDSLKVERTKTIRSCTSPMPQTYSVKIPLCGILVNWYGEMLKTQFNQKTSLDINVKILQVLMLESTSRISVASWKGYWMNIG